MSRLDSGVTYIYERDGTKIYARKTGETERILIGEDYNIGDNLRRSKLAKEWLPVLEAAEQNAALHDALERAKLIYELSKRDDPVFHHPV